MSTIQFFFSEKLNKLSSFDRLRLQMGILEWIFGEIDTHPEWGLAVRLNQWKFFWHESAESNLAEHKALVGGETLSNGIPHGITNLTTREIHVFIPNLGGTLGVLQGHDAGSHEACHAVIAELVLMGRLPQRMKRQYQDKLNRPGTEGNTHTVLVHDRDYEDSNGIRERKKYRVAKYKLGPFLIGSLQLTGIDITDVINGAFQA